MRRKTADLTLAEGDEVCGWDLTLDPVGEVRLMELNTGHPDVKFIEMSQDPTLRAFQVEAYAG